MIIALSANVLTERNLEQRLDNMRDVMKGRVYNRGSCYFKSLRFISQQPRNQQDNYRLMLVTHLTRDVPSHCVVLDDSNTIVFDSAQDSQVGQIVNPQIPVYKPRYRVLAIVSPSELLSRS